VCAARSLLDSTTRVCGSHRRPCVTADGKNEHLGDDNGEEDDGAS
jgi:hypothetical protein